MKIEKKVAVLVVILSLITLSVLTGCQSGTNTSKTSSENEKTTIDFAIHVANPEKNEKAFYEVVKAFEEEHSEIDVNITGKETNEHVKNIKMMSQSNTLPDLFWILPATAEELYDTGQLADLTEFLDETEEIRSSFEGKESMINPFAKDGIQYGLPYQPLVTGFFYNKALFDQYEVEVPETFDDLIKVAKVFDANGVTTIAKGAKDDFSVWAFMTMLSRYGYFDKIDAILKGEESFVNEDFINYYTRISELREAGAFSENVSTQNSFQASQQFMSGDAAMLDGGSFYIAQIEESEVAEDTEFWWGPTFKDGVGNQKLSSIVPSAPIVASKKAFEDEDKKEAILEFFKFYYSDKGVQLMVDNKIPPITDLQAEVDSKQDPVFASVIEAMNEPDWVSQENQPDLVLPSSVMNALYDSIYGVIIGTYTPEEAAQVVQAKIGDLN